MDSKDVERISKALSDPHRIRIMQEVKIRGVVPCSDICGMIDLAQPSVSHHLKQLTDAGLLVPQKEGRSIRYTIDTDVIAAYSRFLSTLTTA
ncbi:MAG: ArsR family transcriptional regulator [Proteobacteria bacterium]|nr:MAG: ArsR family transcriptional regulator [Pseudomonadota bacterium]